MSFLDDLNSDISQASQALSQVGSVVTQAQRIVSGKSGTAAPPTVDQQLHGLSFGPWVIAGIIGLVIVAVAFGVRR